MKKIIIFVVILLNLFLARICLADTFVVKRIEVDGLQRLTPATVYNYLPIRPGETLTPQKSESIIKALYKTGFFQRITLSQHDNVLVITVVERATIGELKISGNSAISTDKLNSVMKTMEIAEGRVYNPAMLDRIRQSLLDQYYQLGRYNARVDIKVTPEDRGRVAVNITISEGLVVKIEHINIIGNHAFSERTLVRQLAISTSGLVSFFTQTDRYSQEKLEASLDALRNFYLDHGYLKMTIKSTQVAITPDHKSVYVTIVVDEDKPYTIKGFDLSGNYILPREEIVRRIHLHPGDTFSRQAVLDSEKSVSDALGDQGYIFAVISLQPKIDDKTREVFLTFDFKPGKKVYVRHIYFSDNSRTNDEALRREVDQMESAVASNGKLEQSKQKLSQLPYLKEVQMSVLPVEKNDEQVDIKYKVTEENAAQMTFMLGYSQVEKFIVGVGAMQKNFMGTGKTLGVNMTQSKAQSYYSFSYTNPYYTPEGISRTINLSLSRTNPGQMGVTDSFTTNQYNASMLYSIPLGQEKGVFNRLQLGYGYENTLLTLDRTRSILTPPSQQVTTFIQQHGRLFQQGILMGGFSRDSLDKAIFPTSGALNSIGVSFYFPVAAQSLKYYTVGYTGKWLHPLTDNGFIFIAKSNLGYGGAFPNVTYFPFFKNYYAGGMTTIHSFDGNSLGPKDSLGNPIGGNMLLTASAGIIFPNHISDTLRTTAFVDIGNVYNTYDNRSIGGSASGPLRSAVGVQADWMSPFGAINVSLSKPFHVYKNHFDARYDDHPRYFDFSIGASFG